MTIRESEEKSIQKIEETKRALKWSLTTFGSLVAVSSSFQTQSLPLLYLISEVVPEVPVLFVDTGFHFPETLEFRDQIVEKFGLNLRVLFPKIDHKAFLDTYGLLYETDFDTCCSINKLEPMETGLANYKAWIGGVRRDQTIDRQKMSVLSKTDSGIYKLYPMLEWTSEDIWRYIRKYDLGEHPLFARGYTSIGCAPCTRSILDDNDERSGRWTGAMKIECGLHTKLGIFEKKEK
tara:strand:+ start:543 stop:1247 length:705 start_codon:yes stop_codon:yes gene_type:complete